MLQVNEIEGGVRISVRLQPRAAKNQIVGFQEGVLKIKVTAPPVDGEANQVLINYLARLLSIPKSACRIVTGEKSRNKTVEIQGLKRGDLLDRLGIEE